MNEAFTLTLGLLAAGYACARLHVFPDDASETLHRFVIYVCLPALVLTLVPKLRWEPALWLVVAMPWLMVGVGALLVLGASRVFGWSREVTSALLLCVPLGNTSFLGFPLIEALLGPDALRYALLYDQFGSFLLLASYGLFVIARFSGEAAPSARVIALRLLKFPPFVALCAGLVLAHFDARLPPPLEAICARVGATLVPVAMFAVGLKLSLRPPRPWPPLVLGLGGKLVVLPLVALAVVHAVGATGVVARVAVLESGMPPMISAGALAIMSGLAPELTAAMIGYGIVLSMVSVPLLRTLT